MGLCACCKWADEFRDFFSQFGEVKEHQIMRDHSSGRSRGFGFITFETEQAVDDLLGRGNRLELAGSQVSFVSTEMDALIFLFLWPLDNFLSSLTRSLYD